MRVSAGKICARRAIVWHEQRVADEGCVTDEIGNVHWRVSGDVHDHHIKGTDRKPVAVCE